MMSHRHFAVVILALVGTATAGAQAVAPRLAGPTAAAAVLTTSRAASSAFDHATLGREAMQRAVAKPNVTGGIIGFVVGAAAGATVGCLANKDDYGVFCAGQNDTKVFVGALVGGAAGAAVGALLFRHH